LNTPYTDSGINGTSVIVGLADTGIDYTSCYFGATTPPTGIVDINQEKIVRYVTTFGDFQDNNGHGTHLAGSIAGATDAIGSDNNGVAPGAKLHFTDLSTTSDGTIVCSISIFLFSFSKLFLFFFGFYLQDIPDNFVQSVLEVAETDGVEIFVAPFGSDANWYSSLSADLDDYLFRSNDVLVITSAGNTPGFGTLSELALAKNVLTVGSCMSTTDGVAQAFTGVQYNNIVSNPALYGSHSKPFFSFLLSPFSFNPPPSLFFINFLFTVLLCLFVFFSFLLSLFFLFPIFGKVFRRFLQEDQLQMDESNLMLLLQVRTSCQLRWEVATQIRWRELRMLLR
jgi:subtilisin family serine protease